MTICSRNPRISSAESNLEAIPRSARFSAARNAQVAYAEVPAQMANIRVPKLWNNKHAVMVQETIYPRVASRPAEDLSVSKKVAELLPSNNLLHVTRSDVQSLINLAMLW